ncbi:MAG: type II toxin-antitoxin system HipA family toxin [Akkermansiaceae bacterium]
MNRLIISLHGKPIGVLDDDGQRIVFQYNDAWLADADALPLSRQLPLQSEPFEGQRVSVFFGGLLPEADSRDQIARKLGISVNNDFAMLERIGGECAGAIALMPEELPGMAPPHHAVRWLSEEEVTRMMQQLPHQPLLAGEEGLRLSLAGAQVKLPVVLDSTSGGVTRVALPLGDTPSTHIIKPEPVRFPGLAENEAWCMALARRIGLDAAETWTERMGNVPCLISKRYDRVQGGSGEIVRRLHQEDFCQALGYPSSRKYQQEGGPSLRECFQMIRDWSTTSVLDIRHMLDAVIFAAITGNADAHGKNHSFVYAQGTRRMAPLYDQVCTMAWPELSTTLSMKIGNASTLAEVSPEHFKQLCSIAKLGWPMVRERIKTLCRQILDATHEPDVLPALGIATVREIVTKRAERMLRLMEKSTD